MHVCMRVETPIRLMLVNRRRRFRIFSFQISKTHPPEGIGHLKILLLISFYDPSLSLSLMRNGSGSRQLPLSETLKSYRIKIFKLTLLANRFLFENCLFAFSVYGSVKCRECENKYGSCDSGECVGQSCIMMEAITNGKPICSLSKNALSPRSPERTVTKEKALILVAPFSH